MRSNAWNSITLPVKNTMIRGGRSAKIAMQNAPCCSTWSHRRGDNPRNPLEVIGRWLLGISEYFEMLIPNLRRFAEFLINLAKAGHGDGLTFEHAGP